MHGIYERIEKLIEKSGLKKANFAKEVGISTGNLGDWKRGKSVPGAKALIAISDYCDVSLDWLMKGDKYNANASKELSEGQDQTDENAIETINLSPVEEELLHIIRELDERNVAEIMSIARLKLDMDRTYGKKGNSSRSTSEHAATIEGKKHA